MHKKVTPFPHYASVPGQPPLRKRHDLMPGRAAAVFRIASIVRLPRKGVVPSLHITHVRLFHAKGDLDVHWYATEVDARIARGTLVTIQWIANPLGQRGSIPIRGLLPAPCGIHPNLFELVPSAWGIDQRVVDHAAHLVGRLPGATRHLLNAIFWEGNHFEQCLRNPGCREMLMRYIATRGGVGDLGSLMTRIAKEGDFE